MTVKELIAKLGALDPELPIMVTAGDKWWHDLESVDVENPGDRARTTRVGELAVYLRA